MKSILILPNSKWYRGKAYSALMKGNKFCCLGLHALDCGATSDDLKDKLYPSHIREKTSVSKEYINLWCTPSWNKQETTDIAVINDSTTMTDEKRLNLLRTKFAAVGITLIYREDL